MLIICVFVHLYTVLHYAFDTKKVPHAIYKTIYLGCLVMKVRVLVKVAMN